MEDDEIRFRALFEAYYPKVVRFAARRTDPDSAPDVAAETSLVAWRRFGEMPEAADWTLAWLQARTERGDIVQWWEAPTTKGGWCTYDHYLVVRENGGHKQESGGEQCGVERVTPSPTEKLNAGYATFLTYAAVTGRAAKPAVQVRLTLKDGQRMTIPLNANGYFMSFFGHALANDLNLSKLSPATIVALDAQGHVLATRHL